MKGSRSEDEGYGISAGLTTRLTRLQPRAPDFLGAPKRPCKGLNEFGLMYAIREILKILSY